MFMGVKTQGCCDSYEGAKAVLSKASRTPTGKQRSEKEYGFPLGGHNKAVTWVREREDGAIAFRLYQTDVVAWHSTEEFEVENYGTTTTSGFASRFLPAGIHLHYPVERRGASGGHRTIGFKRPDDYAICQGDVVLFQPTADSGFWAPDPDTCNEIKLPTTANAKAAREVYQRLNLRDFAIWLEVAPMHLGDVEHAEWDLQECMDALEKRDFRQAAMHLPLIKEPSGFGTADRMKPLPITTPWGSHVTMGSLAKLKLAIWDWENLLDTEERKVWERKAFNRGMARVQEMDALGLSVHDLGPE